MKTMAAVIVSGVGALVSGPATASASQVVVGRWCDRMLPNMSEYNRTIEIKIPAKGAAVAENNFADGSANTQKLKELGKEVYAVAGSPSGDKYRIVPSTGDLQLLDDDGLIRTARRLENKPTPGECK